MCPLAKVVKVRMRMHCKSRGFSLNSKSIGFSLGILDLLLSSSLFIYLFFFFADAFSDINRPVRFSTQICERPYRLIVL